MAQTIPDLAGQRTIKRFRVAREGQTVDGRAVSRQQILDMAETYNPVEYTARINVEHTSGWMGLESTSYPILGDVIAVDAQLDTYRINGVEVQLMGLYATLSALPVLVEANKQGKKLFTSIEFYPKFADTGRAYLVGLAVTDIPASRGVEPLKFSSTHAQTIFSEPQELTLMTVQTHATQPTAHQPTDTPAQNSAAPVPATASAHEDGFLQKLSTLFAKKPAGMSPAEQDVILHAFNKIDESMQQALTQQAEVNQQLTARVEALTNELAQLTTQLSMTPVVGTITAPVGTGHQLTEY